MRMRTGAMAACARTACPLNNDFCSFSDREECVHVCVGVCRFVWVWVGVCGCVRVSVRVGVCARGKLKAHEKQARSKLKPIQH